MKQLLRGEFGGALGVPGQGRVICGTGRSSGGSWQQLWVPAGRASGVCFPEGGGCFPGAPAAGERTWGSASPLVLPGASRAPPQGSSGWQSGLSRGPHVPKLLSPVRVCGGTSNPAAAISSATAAAGKEMGRKGL